MTVFPPPDARRPGGGSGRLVVLCGRSFSGKSTVAAWLREGLDGEVVGFDAINAERGLSGGQSVPVAEWARTGELAGRRVRAALQHGRTVVVDDTSSPRFLRHGWRSLAVELDVPLVLVFLDTAVAAVRQRQLANRDSRTRPDVTDAVMDEHLAGFEPPGPDEPVVVVSESSTQEQVVAEVAAGLGSSR